MHSFPYLLLFSLLAIVAPVRAQFTPAEQNESIRLAAEIESRSPFDSLSRPALLRLIELHEKKGFQPRLVEWYGRYSILSDSSGIEYADEAVDLAKTELRDSLHPLTHWAHYTKANLESDLNRRIELADVALGIRGDGVLALYLYQMKSSVHYADFEPDETGAIIPLAETVFGKLSARDQQKFRPVLTEIRLYHELASKQYDQAKLYGLLLLDQIEESDEIGISAAMNTCYYISFTHTQIGQNEDAMEWALRGLGLSNKDTHERMACNYAMGIACRRAGEPERAIPYLQDAFDGLLKKTYGSIQEISTIGNELARAYFETGKVDESFNVGSKVLEHAPSIAAYNNFASQLGYAGRFMEGLQYLQKALQLGYPGFESQDLSVSPAADLEGKEIQSIISLYLKAIFTMSHVTREGGDPKWLLTAQENIDLALDKLGAPFISSPGLRSAELLGSNDMYNNFLITKSIILYERYLNSGEQTFLRQFLLASEQIKAQNLTKSLEQPTIPESVFAESRQLAIQRAELQQELDLAKNEEQQRKIRNELLELGEFIRVFTERMTKEYSREQEYFYDVSYEDFTAIESQLSSDEVILNYTFFEHERRLFLTITAADGSHLVKLDSTDYLKDEVTEYLVLLRSPLLGQKAKKERFVELGRKLYTTLVEPAESLLNGKENIIVLPDGILSTLPFETLLFSETAVEESFFTMSFLLKKAAISYYPSGTVYTQLQRKKAARTRAYLAFAPVFGEREQRENSVAGLRNSFVQDTVLRSTGLTADGFTPLPNSRREVTTIFDILGDEFNRKLFLDGNATISRLKSEVDRPLQFLHIATHGLVNRENPRLSALAGYENDEQALLYANEIQFLPLNVDLVILSSCDSGIGKQSRGEGILALNRTFLYAGARNVISSLWKVSDRYSSDLMIGFYRNYLESGSYRSALRGAKLELLQNPKTALPRYWAAFMLTGQ